MAQVGFTNKIEAIYWVLCKQVCVWLTPHHTTGHIQVGKGPDPHSAHMLPSQKGFPEYLSLHRQKAKSSIWMKVANFV